MEDTEDKSKTSQTPLRTVKHTNLDMMDIDTINLQEVGMNEGFTIYEKMLQASASDHSIGVPQAFWVGLFFKAIISRQQKEVELLGDLCRYFLENWAQVDERILSTNLRLADIEAQGVSHFPEWKQHVWAAVGQIKVAEISVKTLQQELTELTNSSTKHKDEL